MPTTDEILARLEPVLLRTKSDPRQVVVMTCGISGAGKSTLSKAIISTFPNFKRISIDTAIHAKHGLYKIDYSAGKYQGYQEEAGKECDQRLLELLETKEKDILLDQSFYNKQDRDNTKRLVEDRGSRWILVYLRASKEVLWRRIQDRKVSEKNADSAFEVTKKVLDRFIEAFEAPDDEGEIAIDMIQ